MRIMVLNDGETFTSLDACAIYEVPNDLDTDEIERALRDDSDEITRIVHFTDPEAHL